MLYEQFGKLKYEYRNREFWCRGCYVDTAGRMRSELRSILKTNLRRIKRCSQRVDLFICTGTHGIRESALAENKNKNGEIRRYKMYRRLF